MRAMRTFFATWLLLGCLVCATSAQVIVPPPKTGNVPGMVVQVFRSIDVETDHFEVEICPTHNECGRNKFVPLSKYYVSGYRVHAYQFLTDTRAGQPVTVVVYLVPSN